MLGFFRHKVCLSYFFDWGGFPPKSEYKHGCNPDELHLCRARFRFDPIRKINKFVKTIHATKLKEGKNALRDEDNNAEN